MKIRVMIADDHAVMRDGLKALLEADPDIDIVAEVGDGREAVRQAMATRPDVAIVDIAMPELNGIEAARLLHERCPDVRVVILSMHSDAEYVYRALDAGAAGYLLKESAGEEVSTAVHTVYTGRQYLARGLANVDRRVSARPSSPLESLSSRESQVLQLVVEGQSSADIAAKLNLSAKTVDTYRSRLMKKLGISDVTTLVKFAIQHGITPSE